MRVELSSLEYPTTQALQQLGMDIIDWSIQYRDEAEDHWVETIITNLDNEMMKVKPEWVLEHYSPEQFRFSPAGIKRIQVNLVNKTTLTRLFD